MSEYTSVDVVYGNNLINRNGNLYVYDVWTREGRRRIEFDCRHDVSTMRRQYYWAIHKYFNRSSEKDMRYFQRVLIGSTWYLGDNKN